MEFRRRVLFVDDEPNVLRGLQRMLRSMRKEWDMQFANSGQEALDLLSEQMFDVVVSDMRMPGMDGGELLGKVMRRFPQTVRIILSGHSDETLVLRSIKYTHQFLAKPCDPETLKHTIARTCLTQDLLRNEMLRKVVNSIKRLPVLPSLYLELIGEMNSPDASLKKIGNIIAQDITMTAKVLQCVNSAFFGLPHKVSSPQQAAIYLGMDTLKSLVLYVHVFSMFKESLKVGPLALENIWEHSMMTGNIAREIAKAEKVDKKIADDAFMAGIMHDIGMLVFLNLPGQYRKVFELAKKEKLSIHDGEYRIFGTSHAEVGAYLLGIWGLPEEIVEAVAFHHTPSKSMSNEVDALTAIHVADVWSKDLLFRKNNSGFDNDYMDKLGIWNKLEKWSSYGDGIFRNW